MSKKIVIAGAGVMGASLAQVYALAGYTVVLYDVIEAGIEKGKHLVDLNQETLLNEGIITKEQSEDVYRKISYTMGKDDFKDCDLVLECIIERMDIKQSFWKEVSEMAREDILLATNTSGLSVTEMAKAVKNPERFMGQHWLNPPHLLPLCEIIKGIKARCGNYPVMVRINGSDFVDAGASVFEVEGTTPEQAAETAKILEAAGADAIDVSCGVYITKLFSP